MNQYKVQDLISPITFGCLGGGAKREDMVYWAPKEIRFKKEISG